MILLAIDTAAPRLQLALLPAEGAADVLSEDMPTGQAERLFPALAELLARNGASYSDLTRIAVTTGPGSFTGLRIGLSAARGLGLALNIPVVGIGSLQAISLSASAHAPLVVLLDAKRGEAYFQPFFRPGEPIEGPMLLSMDAALRRLPEGRAPVTRDRVDMPALARFARGLAPELFRPEAAYIRGADAKPQDRFRIAKVRRSIPDPLP